MNQDPEDPADLESQFILSLGREPAKVVIDVLSSRRNLCEIFAIKVNNYLECDEVRLNHRLMKAKKFDLLTILEYLNIIGSKNIYKASDVCEVMACEYKPNTPFDAFKTPINYRRIIQCKGLKKVLYRYETTPQNINIKEKNEKTMCKFVEKPEIDIEVKKPLQADCKATSFARKAVEEGGVLVESQLCTPATAHTETNTNPIDTDQPKMSDCTPKRIKQRRNPVEADQPGLSQPLDCTVRPDNKNQTSKSLIDNAQPGSSKMILQIREIPHLFEDYKKSFRNKVLLKIQDIKSEIKALRQQRKRVIDNIIETKDYTTSLAYSGVVGQIKKILSRKKVELNNYINIYKDIIGD